LRVLLAVGGATGRRGHVPGLAPLSRNRPGRVEVVALDLLARFGEGDTQAQQPNSADGTLCRPPVIREGGVVARKQVRFERLHDLRITSVEVSYAVEASLFFF